MNIYAAGLVILGLNSFSASTAQEKDPAGKEILLYSIGNSHTWDFRPSADFLQIAKTLSLKIDNGWHINCGQNLESIWNNPEQTCVEVARYGTYRDALENYRWDAITIQTFIGGTAKAEKASVKEFLNFISNSINKDCNVFIYCTWPKNSAEQLGEFNYSEAWLCDFQENDTLKILSKKYFRYLENSIENNSDRIRYIPVGRVLYHFDQAAKSGVFPGFKGSGELYRDAWHLNNVGRYIAGLTVFSQIFRIDPVGIPDFESYPASAQWPSDRELTSKQKKAIRRIISEVLNF